MCPRRKFEWRKDDAQHSLGVVLLKGDALGNTYARCLYHRQGPKERVLLHGLRCSEGDSQNVL